MSTIRYQLVEPSQYEEALSFFYDHFLRHEPMSKCLGFDCRRSPALDSLIMDTLRCKLSWCAVEQETGRIVGLRVCTGNNHPESDPSATESKPTTCNGYVAQGFPREIAVQFVLLDEMKCHKPEEGACLEMFGVAVRVEYRQKGICTEMTKRAIEYGVKQGFCISTSICGSKYTQMMYTKLGFQSVKEIKYSDYIVDGKVIFADIKPPHRELVSFKKLLQPSQYDEALSFFYEWYLQYEPLSRASGIDWQTRSAFVDNTVKQMLLSGDVSWCAVEQESGKMIGLLICGAVKQFADREPQPSMADVAGLTSPEFVPSLALIEKARLDEKDAHIELFLISVCEEYKQRGICTELSRRALDHAAGLGYHLATITCSSKYTQLTSIKLGFQAMKEIKYAEYVVDGEVVFPNVEEPHKFIISYRKII